MYFETIIPDPSISLFVKSVMIFEDLESNKEVVLPFFADGFPGLMFHETAIALYVSPHNKIMPPLFLYGQTLKPLQLIARGNFKFIVFQFYPFVLQGLFNIDAKSLNDECYDLTHVNDHGIVLYNQLKENEHRNERIELITLFLESLFAGKQKHFDLKMAQAIHNIIINKGKIAIRDLYNGLHLTERTFERRFYKTAGITAKQFSKIIQFQESLEQIHTKEYKKLTDIVYANGFADQSHFIKVFKAYTGKTPLAYKLNR